MNVNNKDFVMVESESEAAPYTPFWVLGGAWTLSQIVLLAGFPPEALSSLPTPQPWSPPSTRCCADQRTASTEPWTDLLQKNDVTVLSISYKLPPPPLHLLSKLLVQQPQTFSCPFSVSAQTEGGLGLITMEPITAQM